MKILLRALIILLIFEVTLGYIIYLRNSSRLTGNYISSTIAFIDKLGNYFKMRDITDDSIKGDLSVLNCKEDLKDNQVFQIADVNFYRRAIKFQSKTSFLNNKNLSNKYLILISGNSEAYGAFQNKQKRIHTLLEDKLKENFVTQNIFVVNIADLGQLINDSLKSTISFSKLYNPDLVIFYTGGNETRISRFYKNMTDNDESLNIKNQHWYASLDNRSSTYQQCLNENIFLTKNNYHIDHDALNIKNYIKNGYSKIKNSLDIKSIDFIFYIHPFNNELTGDELEKSNIKKLKSIDIKDTSFVNLRR